MPPLRVSPTLPVRWVLTMTHPVSWVKGPGDKFFCLGSCSSVLLECHTPACETPLSGPNFTSMALKSFFGSPGESMLLSKDPQASIALSRRVSVALMLGPGSAHLRGAARPPSPGGRWQRGGAGPHCSTEDVRLVPAGPEEHAAFVW